MQQQLPAPVHAQPLATPLPPGWLKPLLIFSCACTPGGFLFLIALLAETNVHFETPVWLALAAAGAVGGYFAGRRLRG